MSTSEDRFTVKEVVISIREEMREGFKTINERLDATGQQKQADDHESRIRRLERYANAIPSVALLTLIAAVLYYTLN